MSECGALSLGPFEGGGSMFGRGQQSTAGGQHKCALMAGHAGPHSTRSLSPLSAEWAMQTTYLWADEHALTAQVECVPIETKITVVNVNSASTSGQ